MAGVGTAYVSVRVDTSKFEGDLEKMLSRLSTKMSAAGDRLGKDMVRGIKGADWDGAFKEMETSAKKAVGNTVKSLDQLDRKADHIALTFSDAGDIISDSLDGARHSATDLKNELGEVGKELTGVKNAGRNINIGGGGRGSDGSNLRTAGDNAGFLRNALRALAEHAERSRAILAGLFDTAAIGGSAIGMLVGGLSGAAQGLFVVGANAAAMAPALSAATTGILALAQSAVTLKLAFAGVGEAIKAGVEEATPGTAAYAAAAKKAAGLGDEMQKLVKPAKVSRDAIKAAKEAVLDSADAWQDARENVADAAQGIKDARTDLARAYRDAAWSAEDAARSVIDAEEDLASTQVRTAQAQEALNEVRAEALEQLEDIGFAAEDAALGEERASVALEEAYNRLIEVSELSPDNKMRQAAELAFREAELNLRQAKDAREDADAAQAQAAATGIEGTEAYTSAQQDLVSAQEDQAAAAQALLDAQREQARNAITDAESVEAAERGVVDAKRAHQEAIESLIDAHENYNDALQNVKDAQADYRQAVKDSAAAAAEANKAIKDHNLALAVAPEVMSAFEKAMLDMSPSQKEFINRIIGLQGAWKDARAEIAEPLFEGLNDALTTLLDGDFLGILKDGLVGTSEAFGGLAEDAAALVEEGPFKQSFGDVMESNKETIKLFGDAGLNLADSFIQIADAASPLMEDLAGWIDTLTEGWKQSNRAKNASGELSDTFQTAADRVKEFWGFAKELWRTLSILGDAANRAANQFGDMGRKGEDAKDKFGYITSLTDSLKTFNDKLADSDGKVQGFKQALRNLNSVGSALKVLLVDPLVQLGQDKDIQKAFDKMSSPAVRKSMETIAETAGDAAPKIADIAASIIEIVANISQSKAIDHFLDILGKVADLLAKATGWAADTEIFGKSILGWTGYITGAYAAFRILKTALKITTSPFAAVTEGLITMRDNFKLAKGEASGFKGFLKGIGGVGKGAAKSVTGKSGKISGPADEAQAKADGSNITEAFAKGIRAGMKFKDAAMEALRANVKFELKKTGETQEIYAKKIGGDIMEGLEKGIRAGAIEAGIVAADAGRDVVRAVGRGAGTHSPSTITMKDGNDVMEGMEIGLKTGTAEAVATATRAGSSVGRAVGTSAKTAAATSSAGIGPAMGASATASVGKSSGAMGGALSKMMAPLKGVARGMGGLMTLAMGPFGIAIELIILLLPILIPLFKKLEEKTGIFSKTLEIVTGALSWLWEKIQELFGWIMDNWPLLLAILTGPIGLAVLAITENWDKIKEIVGGAVDWVQEKLTAIWDGITAGWAAIQTFFSELWPVHIKPWIVDLLVDIAIMLIKLWKGITDGWDKMGQFFRDLWPVHIKPWIVGLLVDIAIQLIKIWNGITDGWNTIKTFFQDLWPVHVKPWIDGLITDAGDLLEGIWGGIESGWNTVLNWFKGLWTDPNYGLKHILEDLVEDAVGLLDGIWKGLESGFKTTWNIVADLINNYLVDGINTILKLVNVDPIPDVPKFTGMAEGGWVRGPGGPKDDKVLRRLSNKEYVLPARSAAKLGPQALEHMRKHGTLPGGEGGLFGWVKDRYSDIADAVSNGAEAAFKWLLSGVRGKLGGHGIISSVLVGALDWAGDKFAGFGKKKDAELAAAAAASGANYTGPATGWTYPVPSGYLSYSSPRHSPSTALDIGTPTGTVVRAASGGLVSTILGRVTDTDSYGLHMILSHADGWKTLYAHLSNVRVPRGKVVKPGEVIAISGASGGVSGPHLHLELSKNPGSSWIASTIEELRRRGINYRYVFNAAKGGVFSPAAGGTLTRIAEAGRSERVTPLDREGFSPSERKIVELLESRLNAVGGGGGDTYNIQPSAPIDEAGLASMVSRRVAWNRRRGARSA